MSVITETIRIEDNNSISFGNYQSEEKLKVKDFEVNEDRYNVKTYNEMTRIEKNDMLLLETVPGATIHKFKMSDKVVTFEVEGYEDTQITLELESGIEYKIFIDDFNTGKMKSNLSGKIGFSAELNDRPKFIKIERL